MDQLKMIPLIDGRDVPADIIKDIVDKHDYSCHYDHQILPVEDDDGRLAEWLKEIGYIFKSSIDWIAFIGT